MIKKGQLFFLVKSLSGPEKRYLKLNSFSPAGDTKYERLFNFIESQEEESDEAIRQHFRKEKFTRQLHVAKIYLTDLIMKGLRNYHAEDTSYAVILDLLRDAEILYEKELFDAGRLRLRKAERLAKRYGHENLLLELSSWKRKMALDSHGPAKAGLMPAVKAEAEALGKIAQINVLWQMNADLFSRYADKNFTREMEAMKPSTLRAATLVQHLRYACSYMNGNPKKAEKALSLLIRKLDAEPHRLREDPAPYITALSNKIGLLLGQRRWKETEALLSELRKAPARLKLDGSRKLAVRTWLRIFNLELEVYRDTRQFVKAMALVKEIEKYLVKKESSIPADYSIMLQYQAASVCFSTGSFSSALAWTNKILGRNYGNTRNDLQCFARLLNLVLHFELGNIIVLRYAIDNARRFFKKKKFARPFADEALRLFSRLARVYPEDYTGVYSLAYTGFFSRESVELRSNLDYLDLKDWLEGKMLKQNRVKPVLPA
jgi:hypothetical protein